jgi:hypothetical protein
MLRRAGSPLEYLLKVLNEEAAAKADRIEAPGLRCRTVIAGCRRRIL